VFPHFRNSHPSPTVRPQRVIQATLFENFAEHEIGRELRAMSQCLDQHRELLGLVMNAGANDPREPIAPSRTSASPSARQMTASAADQPNNNPRACIPRAARIALFEQCRKHLRRQDRQR
jgi:hypothetical protein